MKFRIKRERFCERSELVAVDVSEEIAYIVGHIKRYF